MSKNLVTLPTSTFTSCNVVRIPNQGKSHLAFRSVFVKWKQDEQKFSKTLATCG